MTAKTSRVLYEFKVGEPPPSDKSKSLTGQLLDWFAWRQSEDERLQRMRDAAHEQLAEGMAAQRVRDDNDLTQH